MLRNILLGWLVVVLVPGVAAAAIEIDADEKVDFSTYETFVVEIGTPARTERASREIVAEVTKALTKAGLRAVEGDPDLIVRTHVLVDAHSLEELADDSQWEFWTGVRNISAYDLGEGTLVIDFIDMQAARIVWRGLTTEKLGGSVEANYNRIPKIVRRLLKRYPGD